MSSTFSPAVWTLLAAVSCASMCTACSSDSGESSPGGAGGSAGTGGSSAPDAAAGDALADDTGTGAGGSGGPSDASAPDAADDAPGSDSAVDAAEDHPAVGACSELGAAECFANNECGAAERCENVGTAQVPVACCVTGARGTGAAGDYCVSENDCESGVCIAGSGDARCSTTCTTADNCPDGMKDCTYIAFSTSNDSWCLPTN